MAIPCVFRFTAKRIKSRERDKPVTRYSSPTRRRVVGSLVSGTIQKGQTKVNSQRIALLSEVVAGEQDCGWRRRNHKHGVAVVKAVQHGRRPLIWCLNEEKLADDERIHPRVVARSLGVRHAERFTQFFVGMAAVHGLQFSEVCSQATISASVGFSL